MTGPGIAEVALAQVARDIALLSGKEMRLDDVATDVGPRRPGSEGVQISFRIAFDADGDKRQGCLMVPFADAVALAGYLMLKPGAEIAEMRERVELDDALKDAVLEIANLIGGAVDNALRWFLPSGAAITTDGCQGVRAGARPFLPRNGEDADYVVAEATATVDRFEPRRWVLLLPGAFADR